MENTNVYVINSIFFIAYFNKNIKTMSLFKKMYFLFLFTLMSSLSTLLQWLLPMPICSGLALHYIIFGHRYLTLFCLYRGSVWSNRFVWGFSSYFAAS